MNIENNDRTHKIVNGWSIKFSEPDKPVSAN